MLSFPRAGAIRRSCLHTIQPLAGKVRWIRRYLEILEPTCSERQKWYFPKKSYGQPKTSPQVARGPRRTTDGSSFVRPLAPTNSVSELKASFAFLTMRTRTSAKRDAQAVEVQVRLDDERPQKRAHRRGPAQPMRGGWDELPHNLGSVKLAPKETDAPFTKVSPMVWLPCDSGTNVGLRASDD